MIESVFVTSLIIFSASLVICLVLTPVMKKVAFATGKVARPRETRWHKKETALLGGVSIFLSTATVWLGSCFFQGIPITSHPFLPIIVTSSAMFVLGLADDIFGMAPQHKLAGQIIIAAIILFLGFKLPWVHSKALNSFLTILWLVGISNAFNLLDNMDGLAGGIALIASGFLFVFNFFNPSLNASAQVFLGMIAAFAGALLGFLVFNFNPASIFMGDAGSLFIGFTLACLSGLQFDFNAHAGGGFVHILSIISIPIFIVFIPIVDTTFVSIMRKLFRRPISQGGKDHSSHRLVAIGFSERKAVLVLYGFSLASGCVALTVRFLSLWVSAVIIVIYLLFVVFFWIYLGKVQVYPEKSILSVAGTKGFTPLLVEITYRRRLLEVALDFVLITVAYYGAYLLRFEGNLGPNLSMFLKSLPILVACQIFSFYLMRIYKGVWESTSVRDLVGYIKGITLGTVLTILILLFAYRFYSFSRAVFVIYWAFMLILISFSRLFFRIVDEAIKKGNTNGKATLVYGAGTGGRMVLKEIETNKDLGLRVVGFIDDNETLHRRKVLGYPVLGNGEDLKHIVKKYRIQEVIVSFKENGNQRKQEVKDLCRTMGLDIKVTRLKLEIVE